MKTLRILGAAVVLGAFVAACGDRGKSAADAAISSAQSAFDVARPEAVKYVPDQVKAVEDRLAAARETAASGNYTQALTEAQDVTAKISALGEAVAARKSELTTSWNQLSDGIPQAVQAIQDRVAALSKSRRLPAGVTRDAFEGAKTGLTGLNQMWTEATEAFKTGNLADAVAKAQTVKGRAAEIMASLGMQMSDAVK